MGDRSLKRVLLWVVAYVASIAFMVALHSGDGPPIWWASVAVGVGLLATGGLRWWPLIAAIEAVAAVLAYGQSPAAILGVALPTALETLAVAWAIGRFRFGLTDAGAGLRLAAAVGVACAGSATLGVSLLAMFGLVSDPAAMWLGWWAGDVTGLATLLPLVMSLLVSVAATAGIRTSLWATIEPVLLMAAEAVIVVGTTIFSSVDPLHREDPRFLWAIPVVLAAVRLDRRATAAVVAVMGATAFAAMSRLPDAQGVGGPLGVQSTLITLGIAGMSIAVAVSNRREAVTEIAAKTVALYESEHRYATLFERSPVMQLLVDPATAEIVDVNEAAIAYYGYSREEFRAMTIPQLSLTEPGSIRHALLGQHAGKMHLTARHRLASGDVRNVEVQTGPLSIDGRELLHSVIRDITDEVAVRRQIARLAAAVESSADAVVTTDLEGVVTSWNAAAERLYGYDRGTALGKPIEQLIGHLSVPDEELAELVRSQGVVRLGHLSRIDASGDAVPVDLVVTQILDEDGNLVGLSRLAHDLRELFEEQERVRRSEALLADAARIGGVGSWEVDATTGDTTWSGELYRLTGSPAGSPVARDSLLNLVHLEDRPAVASAFASRVGEEKPVEFRLVTADGHERSMVATWRTVPGADGAPVREIGVVRDITEERALEVQLRQAQRLESIGLLAGGVAHDFNNLLTAIAGFTDLARLAAADGMSPDADLAEIQGAVDRAKSLTSQLLTFGRRAIVRPRAVRVATAVGELTPLLQRLIGERIKITAQLDPAATVVIDPGQLDQVLVNLVVNARDAMPHGGHLRISAGLAQDTESKRAWLEVTDQGTGIPPDVLDKIFLPFFSTKERGHGTGLGLSTVQGIVVAAGGTISVSSVVGRGTTFRIELAAADLVPERATEPARDDVGRNVGSLVLLVEDEDAVRMSGARILERAGFRVVTAASVPSALAKAALERPDILVTDIVLPGRTEGISLAETLRGQWTGLPVLLITGYTDREPPSWAELLPKPFTAQELVASVQRLAGPSASQAEPVATS